MATSAQLRREILAGQWDEALCTLYGTEPAVLARQRQRYVAALEQFVGSGHATVLRWNSLSCTMAPGGRCMSTRLRAGRSWAATTPIISTGMVLRQR